VRDRHLIDVPQPRQLADVALVVPVAHPRQVAVGAGLAGVLRRRLAVHLTDAGARAAEHAAQQVEVVDLAGRGSRLRRLVEALKHGREQALAGADDPGGVVQGLGRNGTDLGHPLGVVGLDGGAKLVEAQRVFGDVALIDPAVGDDLAQDPVHQGLIGSVARRQVHVGLPGDGCEPRVDDHEARRVGAATAVEHAHPQDRLRLGHVVPPDREGITVIDVGVGAGLPVRAKARFERRAGGGRAQARVAVHVRRAESGLADHGERVVVLEEELT
jgi:hypothetical protein